MWKISVPSKNHKWAGGRVGGEVHVHLVEKHGKKRKKERQVKQKI
jgi:hypothetical protein